MKRNQVRIIGGKWRSRIVHFSNTKELRPTPDRVRETLFNWLAPHVVDSHCLDLYSGTGVLCLEAISRGAGLAVSVEKNRENIKALQQNAKLLEADELQIIEADVLAWLETPPIAPFDIVFVDPPYRANSLPLCFELLEKNKWVKPGSLIYFEYNHPIDATNLPATWELLKQKKAGVVHYHLTRKTASKVPDIFEVFSR